MNTKAIRQLADVTLDKYRSSIPRKAFEEFVKGIIAGENRATASRINLTAGSLTTSGTVPSPTPATKTK